MGGRYKVEDLVDAVGAAPSFGLNGRELLLQAARQRNDEEDFVFETDTKPRSWQRKGQRKTTPDSSTQAFHPPEFNPLVHADLLYTGIPRSEIPTVGWALKSKVNRADRLPVLKRLAGEFLAVCLHARGLPLNPASVAENSDVRKHALTLACQQEAAIYEQCTGRPSYQNLAARKRASLLDEEVPEAPEGTDLDSSNESLFSSSQDDPPQQSGSGTNTAGPAPSDSANESPAEAAPETEHADEAQGESLGACGTSDGNCVTTTSPIGPGVAEFLQEESPVGPQTKGVLVTDISSMSEGDLIHEDPAFDSGSGFAREGRECGKSGDAEMSGTHGSPATVLVSVDAANAGPVQASIHMSGGIAACVTEVQENADAARAGSDRLQETTGIPTHRGEAADATSAELILAEPGLAIPKAGCEDVPVPDSEVGVIAQMGCAAGGAELGKRCRNEDVGSAPLKRMKRLGRQKSSQKDGAVEAIEENQGDSEEAVRVQEHDKSLTEVQVPPEPSLGACPPPQTSPGEGGSSHPKQTSRTGPSTPVGRPISRVPQDMQRVLGATQCPEEKMGSSEKEQDAEMGSLEKEQVVLPDGSRATDPAMPVAADPSVQRSAHGEVQVGTANCVLPPPPGDPAAGAHPHTKEEVQRHVTNAVLGYVRGILDPMYAAKVISKEIYKAVAKKAVDKVMKNHAGAEDASFLLREGFHVQVLVQKYVEYFKARPPAPPPPPPPA